jgi:hypothetical protein
LRLGKLSISAKPLFFRVQLVAPPLINDNIPHANWRQRGFGAIVLGDLASEPVFDRSSAIKPKNAATREIAEPRELPHGPDRLIERAGLSRQLEFRQQLNPMRRKCDPFAAIVNALRWQLAQADIELDGVPRAFEADVPVPRDKLDSAIDKTPIDCRLNIGPSLQAAFLEFACRPFMYWP